MEFSATKQLLPRTTRHGRSYRSTSLIKNRVVTVLKPRLDCREQFAADMKIPLGYGDLRLP